MKQALSVFNKMDGIYNNLSFEWLFLRLEIQKLAATPIG